MSVHDMIVSAGYQAIKHADVCPPSATDFQVAQIAILNEAILIAVDKDMQRIAGRYGSADPKYQRLNLIEIACPEPMAATRIEQVLPLIMLEWDYRNQNRGRRLYVEVAQHWVRTYR